MKIQIVSDLGPPLFGGAETYVVNLGKELVRIGNDVYWNYARIPPSAFHENIEGIDCQKSWVPFMQSNVSFSRLLYPVFMIPNVLRTSKKSDIIQFNSFLAATTGLVAGKISRKPYLLMVHEFFRELWGTVGRNFIERNIYPEIEKLIARSSYPQLICPSEYTKKSLESLGIDEDIINVIYHGIDHSIFYPRKNAKKEFLNKKVIGWTGRIGLSVSKNLTSLLESFKIVKEQVRESILVLQGSDFQSIIPTIDRLGLELDKDIIYRGDVSKDKLPYFYSSCDVFAMPSLSEGFGFSALEAQACGTPVVCFDKGALPEIVKNGETGLVQKEATPESLAEGIVKILSDDKLKAKLSSNGSKWSRNFTWEKSAKKHLEVYDKCL